MNSRQLSKNEREDYISIIKNYILSDIDGILRSEECGSSFLLVDKEVRREIKKEVNRIAFNAACFVVSELERSQAIDNVSMISQQKDLLIRAIEKGYGMFKNER